VEAPLRMLAWAPPAITADVVPMAPLQALLKKKRAFDDDCLEFDSWSPTSGAIGSANMLEKPKLNKARKGSVR